MELFIFFTYLLHQFTFTKPSEEPELSLGGHLGLTLAPMPFKVCATPRWFYWEVHAQGLMPILLDPKSKASWTECMYTMWIGDVLSFLRICILRRLCALYLQNNQRTMFRDSHLMFDQSYFELIFRFVWHSAFSTWKTQCLCHYAS